MGNKVAVIGGGPAGIIAAGYSASKGNKVVLFEKNEKLGKKLFITGKGRCNITNSASIEELMENIVTNRNFMYSAMYSFTNEDIVNLIEGYGVKTKVERGNRVFPASDKSSDVIKALSRFLKDKGVETRYNANIIKIEKNRENFTIFSENSEKEEFKSVIIATGGKSYPSTGSTGDGYAFGKMFGHTLVKPRPALVPCEVKENWIGELQGLSLKNIRLQARIGKKVIFEEFGEMIFTHYGLSGPVVLSMSNYINKNMASEIDIYIDIKPALDEKKLESRVLRDFEKYSKKQFKNALVDLLPNKLIPVVIRLSKIDPEKFVNQINREERRQLISVLKEFKLTFKKFRPIDEAIVTSGGIETKEIDPSTMESKLVSGLFFAGEVIDVDALTGGYNLQVAYSTGYLAGINS